MMQRGNAFTVMAVGVTATTAAASASTAIPNASSGVLPKYIRITATTESYIKLGIGAGTTATTNDMLIQPADSMILSRSSCTHFAVIQGTTIGKVNVVPLDDN